jgi:hypothetical protein
MKRRLPGLHLESKSGDGLLEGLFLVRVDHAFYRWHPQKPFFGLRFSVLAPKEQTGQFIAGRLYCTSKALWKLNWFLRDFGYDNDLFTQDEVDEKTLLGLSEVLRTSRAIYGGRAFQNLEAFAPAEKWEGVAVPTITNEQNRETGIGL